MTRAGPVTTGPEGWFRVNGQSLTIGAPPTDGSLPKLRVVEAFDVGPAADAVLFQDVLPGNDGGYRFLTLHSRCILVMGPFGSGGEGFCDDCLRRSLRVRSLRPVQQAVEALKDSSTYRRETLFCAACSKRATGAAGGEFLSRAMGGRWECSPPVTFWRR